MNKKIIIGIGVALIILVGFLYILPLNGIYGTYVDIDRPSDYIEFKRDGTFFTFQLGFKVVGTWERVNDRIKFDTNGARTWGQIEDDRIITHCPMMRGEVIWERR